jgi:hypothetical protein
MARAGVVISPPGDWLNANFNSCSNTAFLDIETLELLFRTVPFFSLYVSMDIEILDTICGYSPDSLERKENLCGDFIYGNSFGITDFAAEVLVRYVVVVWIMSKSTVIIERLCSEDYIATIHRAEMMWVRNSKPTVEIKVEPDDETTVRVAGKQGVLL